MSCAARASCRVFWFIVGVSSATWWLKCEEWRSNSRYYGHCFRPPTHHLSLASKSSSENGPCANFPRTINNIPPAASPFGVDSWAPNGCTSWMSMGLCRDSKRDREESERLSKLGQQAGDAVIDFSEATLDSVMSTVESWKAKLITHRAERARLRKAHEKQLEQENKPHRPL